MSHANAALTPRARLRLARLIVDDRWPPSVAVKMFMVSTVTARKWAARLRAEGVAGMQDRSSRPRSMPTKTPASVVKRFVRARWRRRLGPVQIAGELGLAPSTVHAVLVRCRINRLSRIDRVTGEPIRRYEHDHPGSLIQVDVTKFGNIPDGGGHRFLGRAQGTRNRHAMAGVNRNKGHQPRLGVGYLHTVVDIHSRVAYVEMHADERSETAIDVLRRATAWFADKGVTVERVLSDNGACYRSFAWRDACVELGIKHKRTRPHPATDQRQNRALPPHPRRRMGVREVLRVRDRSSQRTTGLDPLLQSAQAPLRNRSPADQQAQQPARTSHLELTRRRGASTYSGGVPRFVVSHFPSPRESNDQFEFVETTAASSCAALDEAKSALPAGHEIGSIRRLDDTP